MIVLTFIIILVLWYKIVEVLYKKMWHKNLSVDVKITPDRIVEGSYGELIETVKNEKNMPISNMNIKLSISSSFKFDDNDNSMESDNYYRDDIFSIPSFQKIERTLKFQATRRGCYFVNDIYLISNNIFFERNHSKKIKSNCIVYVYPKILKNFEIPVSVNNSIINYVNGKSLFTDPFAFKGIREYFPYDNIKNVNWRASAKSSKLMVNQYDTFVSLNAQIVFNASLRNFSLEEVGEYGIKIAATLLQKFHKLGIPVSFESNGLDFESNKNISIPLKITSSHLKGINESLAKIDFNKVNENFCDTLNRYNKASDSMLIIISSDIDNDIYNEFKKIKEIRKDKVLYIIPMEKYSMNEKYSSFSNYKDSNIVFWEMNKNV